MLLEFIVFDMVIGFSLKAVKEINSLFEDEEEKLRDIKKVLMNWKKETMN